MALAREATAASSNNLRSSTLAGALQPQAVHLPSGNSDGDAATDSFRDDHVHAVKIDLVSFGETGGRMVFDEKVRHRRGEVCVLQPARHVAQQARGVPLTRTG